MQSAYVVIQGESVEVHIPKICFNKPPDRAGTQLQTFSPQSRRNLLKKLHRMNLGENPHWRFVTLTYPDEAIRWRYTERTNTRNHLLLKWERLIGRPIPGVWRVEWEERKSGIYQGMCAPHMHMLCYKTGFLHWMTLRRMWHEVIGSERAGSVKIKAMTGRSGVIRYVAKYISIALNLDLAAYLNKDAMCGRAWGLMKPNLLPWGRTTLYEGIDDDTKFHLRLFASTILPPEIIQYGGSFTLFGKKAKHIISGILKKKVDSGIIQMVEL